MAQNGWDSGSPSPIATEPARFPQHNDLRPIPGMPPTVSLTAAQGESQSNVQRQLEQRYQQDGRSMPPLMYQNYAPQNVSTNVPQVPPAHSGSAAPYRGDLQESTPANKLAGIFSKFRESLQRNSRSQSKGPPVDPGMNYPRKSQGNQQIPAPVPGVSSTQIPAMPQPGRFSPATQANPIQPPQTSQVQTAPQQSPTAPAPSQQLPATLPGTPALPGSSTASTQSTRQIPELKEAMAPAGQATIPAPGTLAEEPKVATPELKVVSPAPGRATLPVLDFDAPLPEPALRVAPGEPAEAPAEVADNQNADEATGASQEPATASSETETKPYTGQKLEEEKFVEAKPGTAPTEATDEVETQTASSQPTQTIVKANPAPETEEETASQPAGDQRSKMERIAERKLRTGLKGFCPVALRDDRELEDSLEEFSVIYNGARYEFSSEERMERFLQDPARYAPAAQGNDVIHLALTGESLPGSLDYATWYKGRLYLFSGVETMETFVAAPSQHASLR